MDFFKKFKMMKPFRIAARRHPASILMEYESEESPSKKLLHYVIHFDEIQLREKRDEISFLVQSKLNAKLKNNVRLNLEQIQSLVNILTSQEEDNNMKADPERDLNLLDDSELNLVKARMDEDFHKHKIKRTDAEFVYDRQIEFESADEDASWDESEEEDNDS